MKGDITLQLVCFKNDTFIYLEDLKLHTLVNQFLHELIKKLKLLIMWVVIILKSMIQCLMFKMKLMPNKQKYKIKDINLLDYSYLIHMTQVAPQMEVTLILIKIQNILKEYI